MVEIKVTGNTPLEALSSLTAFATHCMSNKDVWNAANRILEAERHEERKKAAAQAAAQAAKQPPEFPKDYDVAPEDPSGPVAGETGPSAAPTEKAANPPAPAPDKPQEAPAPKPATSKVPSLEDIRAKGIEAAKKHGQPAIKAILKELGAENMTNLPEDKRAVFLEKLEGLGESNA